MYIYMHRQRTRMTWLGQSLIHGKQKDQNWKEKWSWRQCLGCKPNIQSGGTWLQLSSSSYYLSFFSFSFSNLMRRQPHSFVISMPIKLCNVSRRGLPSEKHLLLLPKGTKHYILCLLKRVSTPLFLRTTFFIFFLVFILYYIRDSIDWFQSS